MKPPGAAAGRLGAAARATAAGRVRIWDLPTRLAHWSLVALVVFSVLTAKIGGNWIDWHMRSGYGILALVLFRLMWGFAGSLHARFASFVRGPAHVLAYLRDLRAGRAQPRPGHNPLGALSVLALLAVLLLQASTGLFSNDDVASEGPLARLVSNAISNALTGVHKFGEIVIYLLVGLHLAAIAYYYIAKRENLVVPMLTGDKPAAGFPAARDDALMRLRAALLLAIAAAIAWYVATR